ncbi:MAG: chemotaxis protein CheW [Thiomargarita sp.]|nr:chemotaxis protein CheW [Thiomargarita sp.]
MKLSPSQALNRPLIRDDDDMNIALFEETSYTRRLGFYIGSVGLLIAYQAKSELVEVTQICKIPFTANWLQGLINLRGNLVPVFDLHELLQLEKMKTKKTTLLILGQGDTAGAILIEELPVHISFTEQDKLTQLPPLHSVIKPYTSIAYEKQGLVWFNFDHLSFFKSLSSQLTA